MTAGVLDSALLRHRSVHSASRQPLVRAPKTSNASPRSTPDPTVIPAGGIVTGSAQAAVTFSVAVTPLSGQAPPTVTPSAPVTFDDRFLQISTNLLNLLSVCTDLTPCTLDVNETTLSTHSFDFVVTGLSSGNYGITVSWARS
jgi:hypothetical protein